MAHFERLKQSHLQTNRKPDPDRTELAAEHRRVILANEQAYLLGTVFPDIRHMTAGTDPLRRLTHSYKFMFLLIDTARTDREKAFALGNLAHVAQDTASQMFYAPYKINVDTRYESQNKHPLTEDAIDAAVELHYGAFVLLRNTVQSVPADLVRFYADCVGRTAGQAHGNTEQLQGLADKFATGLVLAT